MSRHGRPSHPPGTGWSSSCSTPTARWSRSTISSSGSARVEVRDRQLLVNGQPIWIFGVNRHDHHPDRGQGGHGRRHARRPAGHASPQHHCRAHARTIRTTRASYDLCDELGMYVVDEANIESHAYNTSLCDDDRYRSAWLCTRRPDGRARPQPPERHHVEPRQRERLRREPRRARRLDSPHRPVPARCTTRARVFHDGWVDGGLAGERRRVPDVPDRSTPSSEYGRGGPGRPPAHPVRVQPRDGQLQRIARRLLGGDHLDARPAGWLPLGVEGPRPPPAAARRHACGSPTAASSATCRTTATSWPTVWCRPICVPHPAMQEVAWVHRPVVVALGSDRRSLDVTNRRSRSPAWRTSGRRGTCSSTVTSWTRGASTPGEIAPRVHRRGAAAVSRPRSPATPT